MAVRNFAMWCHEVKRSAVFMKERTEKNNSKYNGRTLGGKGVKPFFRKL